jgi:hypoxanthine-DNA glycosylase
MGDVLDLDLPDMDYQDRLTALVQRRIGLWDVLAQADRPGSLDVGIREARPNDLAGLMASLPDLKVVAFNGAWAAKAGLSLLGTSAAQVKRIGLPISSPAHTQPFTDKLVAWRVLGRLLETDLN